MKLKIRWGNMPIDTYSSCCSTIETAGGWYVCEVQMCFGETVAAYRRRVRSVKSSLEESPPLTTEPVKPKKAVRG